MLWQVGPLGHIVCLHSLSGCLWKDETTGLSLWCLCWKTHQEKKGTFYSSSCSVGQVHWALGTMACLSGKELLSAHVEWVHLGWLANAHPAARASSQGGHPCWQHLDRCPEPHLRGPYRLLESLWNPCSCPSHSLWLETRTTDHCSAGLASFFVNRTGPQEILGGFCTCLCLFPFLNKAETLSGAFQFYVFLISQFSLIINVLVKTCLF